MQRSGPTCYPGNVNQGENDLWLYRKNLGRLVIQKKFRASCKIELRPITRKESGITYLQISGDLLDFIHSAFVKHFNDRASVFGRDSLTEDSLRWFEYYALCPADTEAFVRFMKRTEGMVVYGTTIEVVVMDPILVSRDYAPALAPLKQATF